jgi:hypothetical protein
MAGYGAVLSGAEGGGTTPIFSGAGRRQSCGAMGAARPGARREQ